MGGGGRGFDLDSDLTVIMTVSVSRQIDRLVHYVPMAISITLPIDLYENVDRMPTANRREYMCLKSTGCIIYTYTLDRLRWTA